MASVNPPADAEQARASPEYMFPAGPPGTWMWVGERRECATLPEPCAFRYVIIEAGGRTFAGYAWEV
jgi:hypothetical protein